jgi:hypothetical protein
MIEPLFTTSMLGSKVFVYSTHIEYKFFGQSTSIPINQIASVRQDMPGMQRVTLETTGGRNIKMAVRLRDKDALCIAIMEAQNKG